ncbi:hypothetical protein B296_00049517 [Ensete ventricosum]|uniref:ELK domain-containing protein n=1 Tax=Ensete ventricosum TaxID=4639 RepID=A0A426YBJ0_ENSVE|nr:hypothetical protein B296_00049517 [Ensete ventricosum]
MVVTLGERKDSTGNSVEECSSRLCCHLQVFGWLSINANLLQCFWWVRLLKRIFTISTGVSPGEGTGATMSDDDDDDDQADSETNMFDGCLDGSDGMGFGPLFLTESEKTLMERVRQELKHELKQGYKEKIVDIREEIVRKRRAGKLPGDATSTLKAWWQSHSKWPYPTNSKNEVMQVTRGNSEGML